MSVLGGIVGAILGAIVGAAVGVLFTEVIFANNQSWPDVVPVALAIAGAVAGSQAVRHFIKRSSSSTPH